MFMTCTAAYKMKHEVDSGAVSHGQHHHQAAGSCQGLSGHPTDPQVVQEWRWKQQEWEMAEVEDMPWG